MNYHAHIYWRNSNEREQAMLLRDWLAKQNCQLGRVWEVAIGPHTEPMFQVIYDSTKKEVIESFLENNKNTNSILLHEAINDDLRDHTDGARWLGQELPLNLNIFK